MSFLTDYIRSLDPATGTPSEELFDDFWRVFGQMLRSELRRRGLWKAAPSCLGIQCEAGWTQEALEELAADCYAFVLARLRSLKKQLATKNNIDGLILLNMRHFLHERQKRCDPLGSRVFETLRTAVRESVAAGRLFVLEGDPDVGNRSLLGFEAASALAADSGPRLEPVVQHWNGRLLMDMFTGRGVRRRQAVSRLQSGFEELRSAGIQRFLFKDLADALKRNSRSRWRAMWMADRGETAIEEGEGILQTVVPVAQPGSELEDRQSFDRLVDHLNRSIDELEADAKTRGYLLLLWDFLRSSAVDPDVDSLPSRRRLAAQLEIPRDRLPGLFSTLGRLVESSSAAASGAPDGKRRDPTRIGATIEE